MAIDFWGQSLHTGDQVCYIERGYRQLRQGTIISLGEKQATIQTEAFQENPLLKDKMGYGKTCRDYACIAKKPDGIAGK